MGLLNCQLVKVRITTLLNIFLNLWIQGGKAYSSSDLKQLYIKSLALDFKITKFSERHIVDTLMLCLKTVPGAVTPIGVSIILCTGTLSQSSMLFCLSSSLLCAHATNN